MGNLDQLWRIGRRKMFLSMFTFGNEKAVYCIPIAKLQHDTHKYFITVTKIENKK